MSGQSSAAPTVLALFALLAAGCNARTNMAPAFGTVQHAGKPVSQGRVVFRPLGGGATAIGVIQPDGSFALEIPGQGKGALVGDHRVLILDVVISKPAKTLSFRSAPTMNARVERDRDNQFHFQVAPPDWSVIED